MNQSTCEFAFPLTFLKCIVPIHKKTPNFTKLARSLILIHQKIIKITKIIEWMQKQTLDTSSSILKIQ